MTDRNDLLDHAVDLFPAPEGSVADVHRDLARRQRNRKLAAVAVVVGIWLVIGIVAAGFGSRDDSVPAQTPSPTVEGIFSSVGGWITFQDGPDGQVEAIAPDGSEQTVLLDGRKHLWAPDWSPDGTRLLVMLDGALPPGDLAIIESDGIRETTLVHLGDDASFDGASFSPDGATVVYAGSQRGAGNQLWTVASDGSGEPRLLLESKDSGLYEPTYSPDGTQIAYVDGGGDHSHTIRVANADGTEVRVLIEATPPFDGIGHIEGLDWSPDGSLIAVGLGDSEGNGIYTVRPDGTDLRLLIPLGGYPAWSPDGSQIAYGPGVSVANADGSDHRSIHPVGSGIAWNPGAPEDPA